MNEKHEPAYMEGWLKVQVSNIRKAFEIIQRYNIDANFSTREKNVEFDPDYLTIDLLISILQELKPLCVPLENAWSNLMNEFEEDEDEDKLNSKNREPAYMDGWLEIQVSDIKKAFEIIQKHNIDVEFSTGEKKIKFDLESLTIDLLISILQELKPLCVPLKEPWEDEEDDFDSSS
jgi:bifunctional DNase/RNase